MADLIDRKAVIDVITNAADKWDCSDDYQRGIKAGIRMGTLICSLMPSKQPEIIRCQDCGHWIPGFINDNDDFIPPRCGKGQQMVGHFADDFCSYGEPREAEDGDTN